MAEKSLRQELLGTIFPANSLMELTYRELIRKRPQAELEAWEIADLKKYFGEISGFCQEALEKIALRTGKKKLGEHQNFSPAEQPYRNGSQESSHA